VIAVVQRVSTASVCVESATVARIESGLLVLVGASHDDTGEDARALGRKIVGLRVFADDDGLMNRSVAEVEGQILVVSQFTLLGEVSKGRRPSFIAAAVPAVAAPLVEEVVATIGEASVPVQTGIFGAHMSVALVNDGPVTVIVRTESGRVI
jgi:D-tyrosyl-tRNA(Tyr) deacylase